MSESQDSRLVMFHCPAALCDEMDALCEYNMVDRTDFLLQAIHSLLHALESQNKVQAATEAAAYPMEDEDDALLAAEESED